MPTLIIHPEDFEGESEDAIRKKVSATAGEFFNRVTGDSENADKLSKAFSANYNYIPDYTVYSAGHRDYSDAHNATLDDGAGHQCSIIVAPRANISFSKAASDLTGVKQEVFDRLPVSSSQQRLLTYWHELAHGTKAGEAQADKMSAIIYRKASADTRPLQVRADLRALDAVFTHDRFMGNNPNFPRARIYGWQPVDAIDSVVDMQAGQIGQMNEQAVKELSQKGLSEKELDVQVAALHKVGNRLNNAMGEAMRKRDLPAIADGLQDLLAGGEFMDDPEALRVALRFLLAAERVSTGQYGPAPASARNPAPAPATM